MKYTEARFIEGMIYEINAILDVILKLVHEDYSSVKVIVEKNLSENNELQKETSLLIVELQHYDTLCQKCEHLKMIHQWILKELQLNARKQVTFAYKGNIMQLNKLQFELASSDYLNSVKTIQSILAQPGIAALIDTTVSANIFKHLNLVKQSIQVVESKYKEVAKAGENKNEFDLQSRCAQLNELYSMQSERDVLKAYVDNPTLQSLGGLQQFQESGSSTIDLF